MLVRDRMTRKVVTARPEWPLAKARELLRRERIRQLPVVRQRHVVGVITDRDLRSRSSAAGMIGDVMSLNPVLVSPAASVDEAARILRKRKFNALPVVEHGALVGILTASDVMDAFVELSGVAEVSYRLVVKPHSGQDGVAKLRQLVAQHRGEVKWLHRDDRKKSGLIHLRIKARSPDEIVDAVQGAGFEVESIVSAKELGAPGRR